jgi:hypothetical protein
MPIFEEGEKITPKEMERQQKALNEKVKRLEQERLKEIEELERMYDN